MADFFFAGQFPSPSTVPRFYGYHVVFAPLLLSALIAVHLLMVFKQKHTELAGPVASPADADERMISGVPFWPGQTVLMVELFLLLVAALAALSALLPVHPSALFGPPQPVTPEVKPDWYLMWVYGTLKMIPGDLSFRFLGATIGSEAVGALAVPGLLGLLILLVPWLDRAPASARWAEHPLRSPRRLGVGVGGVALFLVLSVAGFSGELKLSVPVLWVMAVLVPLVVGWGAYGLARRAAAAEQRSFNPGRVS